MCIYIYMQPRGSVNETALQQSFAELTSEPVSNTLQVFEKVYIYIPLASKPQKNDGFNWKHRVYTLYQLKTRVSIQNPGFPSKTPGFLPSGSQAGIKRSKSWLGQDNLAKT